MSVWGPTQDLNLLASSPVPLFWRWNAQEAKKVGPGIHCLCMRYKNLMSLIIKSCKFTSHTNTVLFLVCSLAGQTLFFSFLFIGGVVGRKIIVWSNSHA